MSQGAAKPTPERLFTLRHLPNDCLAIIRDFLPTKQLCKFSVLLSMRVLGPMSSLSLAHCEPSLIESLKRLVFPTITSLGTFHGEPDQIAIMRQFRVVEWRQVYMSPLNELSNKISEQNGLEALTSLSIPCSQNSWQEGYDLTSEEPHPGFLTLTRLTNLVKSLKSLHTLIIYEYAPVIFGGRKYLPTSCVFARLHEVPSLTHIQIPMHRFVPENLLDLAPILPAEIQTLAPSTSTAVTASAAAYGLNTLLPYRGGLPPFLQHLTVSLHATQLPGFFSHLAALPHTLKELQLSVNNDSLAPAYDVKEEIIASIYFPSSLTALRLGPWQTTNYKEVYEVVIAKIAHLSGLLRLSVDKYMVRPLLPNLAKFLTTSFPSLTTFQETKEQQEVISTDYAEIAPNLDWESSFPATLTEFSIASCTLPTSMVKLLPKGLLRLSALPTTHATIDSILEQCPKVVIDCNNRLYSIAAFFLPKTITNVDRANATVLYNDYYHGRVKRALINLALPAPNPGQISSFVSLDLRGPAELDNHTWSPSYVFINYAENQKVIRQHTTLQTLYVATQTRKLASALDLPPSLTLLDLGHSVIDFLALADLPRSLTSLVACKCPSLVAKTFPPNLTELWMPTWGVRLDDQFQLPPTLKRVCLSPSASFRDDQLDDLLQTLPQLSVFSLEKTNFVMFQPTGKYCAFDTPSIDPQFLISSAYSYFDKTYNNKLKGLKNFQTELFLDLAILPASITKILTPSDTPATWKLQNIPALPIALRTLQATMYTQDDFSNCLKHLPATLHELRLALEPMASLPFGKRIKLDSIPEQLEVLEVSWHRAGTKSFAVDAILDKLPKSLTELRLEEVEFLPPIGHFDFLAKQASKDKTVATVDSPSSSSPSSPPIRASCLPSFPKLRHLAFFGGLHWNMEALKFIKKEMAPLLESLEVEQFFIEGSEIADAGIEELCWKSLLEQVQRQLPEIKLETCCVQFRPHQLPSSATSAHFDRDCGIYIFGKPTKKASTPWYGTHSPERFIQSLPNSLRTLRISDQKNVYKDLSDLLHATKYLHNLTSLALDYTCDVQYGHHFGFDALPRSLKRLELSEVNIGIAVVMAEMSQLPPGLNELVMPCLESNNWSADVISSLPADLTLLHVHSLSVNAMKYFTANRPRLTLCRQKESTNWAENAR